MRQAIEQQLAQARAERQRAGESAGADTVRRVLVPRVADSPQSMSVHESQLEFQMSRLAEQLRTVVKHASRPARAKPQKRKHSQQ